MQSMKCCLLLLLVLLAGLTICGCGKTAATTSGEATLDDLNRAYTALAMGTGHPPASLQELMAFPALSNKTLPRPPAGKKLILDPKTSSVVFADQQPDTAGGAK